jgi:hypothetical protein
MARPVSGCPLQRRPVRFDHAPSTDPTGHPPDDHRRRYRDLAARILPGHPGSAPRLVVALSRPTTGWVSLRHHVELGLGGNGMRGLRDHWVGGRPRHSHEYSGRTRGVKSHVRSLCGQREREFRADRFRRPRVLDDLTGTWASRTPPSQSSFPFVIFTILTEENPASFNHDVVSATE